MTISDVLLEVLERHAQGAPSIPGAMFGVFSASRGIDWRGATGVADPVSGESLTPDHAFRIASNTKTFTAATALRLAEDGRLDLDAPITSTLSEDTVALLRSGEYDPDAMLVRQLLWHNSGMFDHTNAPVFSETLLARPQTRWSPREQIRIAAEEGEPCGAPGEVYSYSDTGYVLLGEIIQRASGFTLAAAFRELLGFERLGLTGTYMESIEVTPPRATNRAHQMYLEHDTYGWDPSMDLFGGGGLVSTLADLMRFYTALVGGDVFRSPETLATMTTVPPSNQERGYAMGVWRADWLPRHVGWSHSGFWGTYAMASAEADIAVALSFGQFSPPGFDHIALCQEVVGLVAPDLI